MKRRPTELAPVVLGVALIALPILCALQLWYRHVPVLAIASVQCIALVAVFFALHGRTVSRGALVAIGASSLAMVAIALAVPTSGDAWAYVGYAILPHFHDAYNPPNIAFHGDFKTVNDFIGKPITPCVYGPFWLLYDRLMVHWVPTLAVGVAVIKAFAAVTFVALLVVLRRLGVPLAMLAMVAVNPALIIDAVWAAHNDFVATLLCLTAMLALGGRRIVVAIALVAAAILIKITFAVVALVIFGRAPARVRVFALAASLGLAALVLALAGGRDYLHALTLVGGHTWQNPGRFGYVHVLSGVIAVCLAAVAFLRGKRYPSLAWTFVALSTALYSWYLAWALPYLARSRGAGVVVPFAAWPFFLAINDGGGRPLTPMMLFTALFAIAAFDLVRAARRSPVRVAAAVS